MEAELIAWFRRTLPPHPRLLVGPGDDDAAVVRWRDDDLVLTVDVVTDQVDFRLDEIDARLAGHKALAVNLSDLAAMAARPVAAVIGLVLPCAGGLELAKSLYAGLVPLAERYGVALAGGDVNTWDGPLAISVTLVGEVPPGGALRRNGGRVGDRLLATGDFGGSILGRHLTFEPRVHEALLLRERYELHAGIDVSDGLSLDAAHLAEASGAGVALELTSIPIAPAAQDLSSQRPDGQTPLEHALYDGEDFELLLAVPPKVAEEIVRDQPLGVPVTDVGRFVAEPGLWQVDAAGRRTPLAPRGWQHRFEP